MPASPPGGDRRVGTGSAGSRSPAAAVLVALGVYLLWTALTWLLEGRIRTLRRPDAVVDRLVYTGVANVLVGTVLGLVVAGSVVGADAVTRRRLGFPRWRRSAVAVVLGGLLGAAVVALQRPPTTDPVVLANVFAQTLPVSVAEVVVCWVVVGGAVAGLLRRRGAGPRVADEGAIAVSAVLFGLSHLAHSPPFNSGWMVALLTAVGVGTGLVFAVGRSAYGALAFHNCMALVGVVGSLAAAGGLDAYRRPLVPLLATAVLALAVLLAAERLFVRPEDAGGEE